MAYHSRLACEAGRPFPVQIGGRTFRARPVSVPVMLSVMTAAASGDVVQMAAAEYALLRAAFPAPKWWDVVGRVRDPLRVIARLDGAVRKALVSRLVRVPHDEVVAASDPVSAIAAAQKAARGGGARANGPTPTLLLAAQACRARFGEAWYFAPDRWATVDGYVPHDVAWVEFAGLAALEARDQLVQVQAHAVAHSGKQARHAMESLVRAAYPRDPLTAAPVRGGLVH